jgi:hypothetical protein
MSEFIITPTNVDFLESIFRNPITGRWTIPILTFNTNLTNPYYGDIDPLNNDPKYQKHVIDHFYVRLTEKWLYKDPIFKSLLKYFKVEKKGDEAKVSLVPNMDSVSKSNVDEKDRKYVYRYIEKVFITKKFVAKVLKQYVGVTHIKWYDLFYNTDTIKDLFVHKLKKLIVSTIYELEDRKADVEKTFKNERIRNDTYDDSDDDNESNIWDNTK